MPLPKYYDAISHPTYKDAPLEERRNLNARYWKAYTAENPDDAWGKQQMADSWVSLDAQKEMESAPPILKRALELQRDAANTRLVGRNRDSAGAWQSQEERDTYYKEGEAALAPKRDAIKKTFSLFDPKVDKEMQPTWDALSKTALESGYFGERSLRASNMSGVVGNALAGQESQGAVTARDQYQKVRDTVAKDFNLESDEVDDLVKHRMGLQEKTISRDAAGGLHIKPELLSKGSSVVAQEIEKSDLPSATKTKLKDVAPLHMSAYKAGIIQQVKEQHPELARTLRPHWNGNVDHDYNLIDYQLNQSMTAQAGEGMTGGLLKGVGNIAYGVGLALDKPINAVSQGIDAVDRSMFGEYGQKASPQDVLSDAAEEGLINPGKAMQSRQQLSKQIYGQSLQFLGMDVGDIGSVGYSLIESVALGGPLSKVGPALVTADRIARAGKTGKTLLGAAQRMASVAPIGGYYGLQQGVDVLERGGSSTDALIAGGAEMGITMFFSGFKLGGQEDLGVLLANPEMRKQMGKSVAKAWGELGLKGTLGAVGESLEEDTIYTINTLFVESKLNPGMTVDDFKKGLIETTKLSALPGGVAGTLGGIAEQGTNLLKPTHERTTDELHATADAIAKAAAQENIPPVAPKTPAFPNSGDGKQPSVTPREKITRQELEEAVAEQSPEDVGRPLEELAEERGLELDPGETPSAPSTPQPTESLPADETAAPPDGGAVTPISQQPSENLPARSTENVEPAPVRGEGESFRDFRDRRDAWEEKYRETHNADGTPYQPTKLDEAVQQILRDTKDNSFDQNIDAVGVDTGAELGTAVTRLLDDGWVWDAGQKKMVNPNNPSETAGQGLRRIRGATTPTPPAPAPAPAPATATKVTPAQIKAAAPQYSDQQAEFIATLANRALFGAPGTVVVAPAGETADTSLDTPYGTNATETTSGNDNSELPQSREADRGEPGQVPAGTSRPDRGDGGRAKDAPASQGSGRTGAVDSSQPAVAPFTEDGYEAAKDIAAMRRSSGTPNLKLEARLAAHEASLRGEGVSAGEVFSEVVMGHPQGPEVTDNRLSSMVPIKVRSVETAERKLAQAQKTRGEIQQKVGMFDYQFGKAKTKAEKNKLEKHYPKNQREEDRRFVDLVVEEVEPALQKLVKQATELGLPATDAEAATTQSITATRAQLEQQGIAPSVRKKQFTPNSPVTQELTEQGGVSERLEVLVAAAQMPPLQYTEMVNRIGSAQEFNATDFANKYAADPQGMENAAAFILQNAEKQGPRAVKRAKELRKAMKKLGFNAVDRLQPAPGGVGTGPVTHTPEQQQKLARFHELRYKESQSKLPKGKKLTETEQKELAALTPEVRHLIRETVDPENDPTVGVDINGTDIRQSKQGTYYTVENGRVRTGPAFSEETPAPPLITPEQRDNTKPEQMTPEERGILTEAIEVGDEVEWTTGRGDKATASVQRIKFGKAGVEWFGYKLVPLEELTLKEKSRQRQNRERIEAERASKPAPVEPAAPTKEATFSAEEIALLDEAKTPQGWKFDSDSRMNMTLTDLKGREWTMVVSRSPKSVTLSRQGDSFTFPSANPAHTLEQRDNTKPEQMTPEERGVSPHTPSDSWFQERWQKLTTQDAPKTWDLKPGVKKAKQVEGDARFHVLRKGGTYRSYNTLREVFDSDLKEYRLRRMNKQLPHGMAVQAALKSKSPVSAEAVDTYGIKLPEGYVKQGDLYVYAPEQSSASSTEIDITEVFNEPPLITPAEAEVQGSVTRDNTKPEQMTPNESYQAARKIDPAGANKMPEPDYDKIADDAGVNFKIGGDNTIRPELQGGKNPTAKFTPEEEVAIEVAVRSQGYSVSRQWRQKTRGGQEMQVLQPGQGFRVEPPAKNYGSSVAHAKALNTAVKAMSPVSAEAVDTYGIKLPEGYVKQGDLYVYAPEQSSAPTTPQAVAPAEQQGTDENEQTRLFQMAGEKANLPARMRDSLDAAKAMAAAGKTSEEIRAVTGWFPGKYDGKMRWEIPDSGATWVNGLNWKESGKSNSKPSFFGAVSNLPDYDPSSPTEIPLAKLLNHEKLFEAYPALRELPVRSINLKPAKAAYGGDSISVDDDLSPEEAMSSILHEIQHAIQDIEGFGKGGNSRNIDTSNKRTANEKMVAIQEDLDRVAQKLKTATEAERDDLIKHRMSLLAEQDSAWEIGRRDPYQDYLHTAGEIEARDVQARAKMTPEQLKATAPYSSENIAPETAIVLFQSAQEGPRAEIIFNAEAAKAIIRIHESGDIDSFLHELIHFLEKFVLDPNNPLAVAEAQRRGITPEMTDKLIELMGGKQDADGKWQWTWKNSKGETVVSAKERFARSGELYFLDGKLPDNLSEAEKAVFKDVFDKISEWMGKIYEALMGSNIKVTIQPEVREILDKLLFPPQAKDADFKPNWTTPDKPEKKPARTLPPKIIGPRKAIMDEIAKEHDLGAVGAKPQGFTEEQLAKDALADIAKAKEFDALPADKQRDAKEPPRVGPELVSYLLGNLDLVADPKETMLLTYEAAKTVKEIESLRARMHKEGSSVVDEDIEAKREYLRQVRDLLAYRGSQTGSALRAYRNIVNEQFEPEIMLSDYYGWQNAGKPKSQWVPVSKEKEAEIRKESAEVKKALADLEAAEERNRDLIRDKESLVIENLQLKDENAKLKARKTPVRAPSVRNVRSVRDQLAGLGFTRGEVLEQSAEKDAPQEDEQYARHAELEAKHNAGTITPEETAEAERLVEERARAAGYNVEAWQGHISNLGPIYKKGKRNPLIRDGDEKNRFGFYFSRDEQGAKPFAGVGGELRHLWLKMSNPLNLTELDSFAGEEIQPILNKAKVKYDFEGGEAMEVWRNLYDGDAALSKAIQKARYDGVIFNELIRNEDKEVLVVFRPEQIKSADPFTGVPLDQRFQEDNPSILYQQDFPTEALQAFADLVKALRSEGKNAAQIQRELDAYGVTEHTEAILSAADSKTKRRSPEQLAAEIDPDKDLSPRMIYNMAYGFLQKGLRGKKMLNAILELVQQSRPETTYNDVVDAYTGYGKTKFPSNEEIAVLNRKERRIALINRQIFDIRQKQLPKLTGLQRDRLDPNDPDDQEIRHLTEERGQLMRDLGLTEDSVNRDQMKGTLSVIKTRYENDIADLQAAIDKREAIVKKDKREPQTDAELEALKKQKKAKQAEYNSVFGVDARKLTEEQRLAAAERALDREIKIEEEMAVKGILERTKPAPLAKTPAMTAKAKKLADLRAARNDENRRLAKEAKELLNPPKTKGQQNTESLEKQVQNAIDRAEYFLKHGEMPPAKNEKITYERETFPVDLFRIKEDLEAAIDYIKKDKRKTDNAQKEKKDRAVAQLEKLRDDLEEQINTKAWDSTATPKAVSERAQNLKETIKILRSIKERTQKLDPAWIQQSSEKWNITQQKKLEKSIERFEHYLQHGKYPDKTPGVTYTKNEIVTELVRLNNELKDTVVELQRQKRLLPLSVIAANRRNAVIKGLAETQRILQKQLDVGIYTTPSESNKTTDPAILTIRATNKALREAVLLLKKTDPNWVESQDQKRDIAFTKAAEKRAEKYADMLAKGLFYPAESMKHVPSKELDNARFKAHEAQRKWLGKRQQFNAERAPTSEKLTKLGQAFWELMGAFNLGFDIAFGRQGLLPMLTNPALAKTWYTVLKNSTEEGEHTLYERLSDPKRSPVAFYMQKFKVAQYKLYSPHDHLKFGKEDIPRPELLAALHKLIKHNKWLRMIPGGATALSTPTGLLIRLERANRMAHNIMSDALAAQQLGKNRLSGSKEVTKSDAILAANAAMVGVRRGSFRNEQMEKGFPLINLFFLSGRYLVSGLQYATGQPVWTARGGYRGTLKMRARIAWNLYGRVLLSAQALAYALGWALYGDDEEKWKRFTNPLDNRYMILTHNGVDYNFFKAITPYVSIISKLVMGYKVTDGKIVPLRGEGAKWGRTIEDEWGTFLKNRRSLRLALVADIADGEHYDGSDVTAWSVFKKMVTPINFANDLKILESEQVPLVQKALSLTAIHLSLDAQMQRAAKEKKAKAPPKLRKNEFSP